MTPPDTGTTARLLEQTAAQDFLPPDGQDAVELARAALPLLGSTDPYLRDTLAYGVLSRWIVEGVLPDGFLRETSAALTGERYLFHGIGSDTPGTVYGRTFSLLILASIVYRHRSKAFLERRELESIASAAERYALRELNFTGYDAVHGWAHSAAHAADLLDELFQCRELDRQALGRLLEALGAMLLANPGVYAHAEDERIAFAVNSLALRGETELVIEWLGRLAGHHRRDFSKIEAVRRAINIRQFFRALCLYANETGTDAAYRDFTATTAARLMRLR